MSVIRESFKIILTIVAVVLIYYSWIFVPQIVRGTLFSDLGLILWGVMSFIILWGTQKLESIVKFIRMSESLKRLLFKRKLDR